MIGEMCRDVENNMNKDENIIRAVESIELGAAAQRRMYENILEKAERKRRTARFLRIAKTIASTAACLCVVIAAAVLLQSGFADSDSLSGGVDIVMKDKTAADAAAREPDVNYIAGEQPTENAEYAVNGDIVEEEFADADATIPYLDIHIGEGSLEAGNSLSGEFEQNEGRNDSALQGDISESEAVFDGNAAAAETVAPPAGAVSTIAFDAGISEIDAEAANHSFGSFLVNFPEGAENIERTSSQSIYDFVCADFIYDGHTYTVGASLHENAHVSNVDYEDIGMYSDSNAELYYEETDGGISSFVRWSGSYYFILSNYDGADREEMIKISSAFIEANR